MRTKSIAVALGMCAVLLLATAAPAQHKKTKKHTVKKVAASVSGAETGLVGIKLFDSGTRVVAVYGSPDVIEPVTLGGGAAGPGGGAAGGGRGGPGLPGGGGPMGAPRGATASNNSDLPAFPDDFDFGGGVLNRQGIPMVPGKGGPNGPPPGVGGGGPMGAPRGMGPGGMGPGGGTAGTGDRVLYTRWVYNRNASKYSFIVDKFDHVVQCEAIGIQAGKAKTKRGITFGSTFAQIIGKYKAPDGYEISGDNIVVRYLSNAKCAFRLNRLGENKPYVVTGIVVAAGKR